MTYLKACQTGVSINFALIAALFLLVNCIGLSQHSEMDSLRRLIHNHDNQDTIKANLYYKLANNFWSSSPDSAVYYSKLSYDLSRKIDYKKGVVDALNSYIAINALKNNYKVADSIIKITIDYCEEFKLQDQLIRTYRNAANSQRQQGNYYEAINYSLIGLSLAKRDNNLIQAFRIQSVLGAIYQELKNPDYALTYLIEAYDNYKKTESSNSIESNDRIAISTSLGGVYSDLKTYSKAAEYYNIAYHESVKIGDNYKAIVSSRNVAYCHFKSGQITRALNELKRSIEIANNFNNNGLQALLLTDYVEIKLSIKQTDSLLRYARQSFDYAVLSEEKPKIERSARLLAEVLDKSKNFKESNYYLKLAYDLNDSIKSASLSTAVANAQKGYEIGLRQAKIEQLEIQSKNRTLVIILIATSSTFIFALGILIISKQRLRIKSNELAFIKEKQLLEVEIKAKELIEKQLKIDLEFKTKELTTQTLNFIQKTELMDEVKSQIEELSGTSSDETKLKLNKLVKNLNFSQRIDKDWENFRLYFEQVHQGFFDNLYIAYPNINPGELRLCALLRLNMTTKQIASVLDITPESAKVARHRLRKKLGISSEENLQAYLNNVG